MKKQLLAVAVAAAVAAPAAMADTTLYGKAHLSVDYISVDRPSNPYADDSNLGVSSNSSRLGVKGSEKLGNGLSVIYQYETTINLTGEGGYDVDANWINDLVQSDADDVVYKKKYGLFGDTRNSFIGLSGGFGTVLAGIHDTPMKLVGRQYDLFGDQVGDSRNIIGVKDGGLGIIKTGFDLRPNNVIAYVSPNLAGFQAIAAYVTDHNVEDSISLYSIYLLNANAWDTKFDLNDYDAYSLSLSYKQKMFDIAAAYEAHNIDSDSANALGVSDSESAYRIGAGVNFAGLRVNALYQKSDDAGFEKGAERTVWGLGAAYKFGKNTIKAQYFMADDFDDGDSNTNDADTGAKMWALGYDYKLSKQTTLYAAYALTDNDANAHKFTATGGGHGDNPSVGVDGGKSSAFSVGIVHKF